MTLVKFKSYHKENAQEIQICGSSAIFYSQVALWVNQLNSGRENVKGNERGRKMKLFFLLLFF